MRGFGFAVVCVMTLASQAMAADAALKDFFGEWIGSGKAKDSGATTQNRDTTVTIERLADGFRITWSTMRTQIEDQASSVVKSTTLKFKGTANPKLFHLIDSGDPVKGGPTAWATLEGATLRIQQFQIEANGDWSVGTYDRTLTAPGAMDVKFRRIVNGKPAREAQLSLVKSQ